MNKQEASLQIKGQKCSKHKDKPAIFMRISRWKKRSYFCQTCTVKALSKNKKSFTFQFIDESSPQVQLYSSLSFPIQNKDLQNRCQTISQKFKGTSKITEDLKKVSEQFKECFEQIKSKIERFEKQIQESISTYSEDDFQQVYNRIFSIQPINLNQEQREQFHNIENIIISQYSQNITELDQTCQKYEQFEKVFNDKLKDFKRIFKTLDKLNGDPIQIDDELDKLEEKERQQQKYNEDQQILLKQQQQLSKYLKLFYQGLYQQNNQNSQLNVRDQYHPYQQPQSNQQQQSSLFSNQNQIPQSQPHSQSQIFNYPQNTNYPYPSPFRQHYAPLYPPQPSQTEQFNMKPFNMRPSPPQNSLQVQQGPPKSSMMAQSQPNVENQQSRMQQNSNIIIIDDENKDKINNQSQQQTILSQQFQNLYRQLPTSYQLSLQPHLHQGQQRQTQQFNNKENENHPIQIETEESESI